MFKEIKKEQEEQLKEKARETSVKEAAAFSFMDGFGLRFISPFAIKIGSTNNEIGLLSSIPSLFGNLSQLLTHQFMEKYPRKNIVSVGVFLQALMWLPIIGIAIAYFIFGFPSTISSPLLIIIYTLLIMFGAFSGPAWFSWMNDIVGKNKGEYFGKRAAIAGFLALLGMLIAGWILDKFASFTSVLWGFVIIFSIAFLGRSISALYLTKQHEPKFKISKEHYFSFFDFIKKIPYNNFGRFVIYISLTSFATSIAGPFFVVYMYRDLGFSNLSYSLAIIIASLSTIIFQPAWGKFADKYGNVNVLKKCGALVPLIPLFWLPTPIIAIYAGWLVIPYIMSIQVFSGFSWAGFNLSVGNFIYDAVSREKIALCVAYFNIINASGVFIGAFIGGLISSSDFMFLGLTPILFVFLLSGISRFIVSSFMQSQFNEVRPVQQGKAKIKEVFSYSVEKIGDFLGMRVFKNQQTI